MQEVKKHAKRDSDELVSLLHDVSLHSRMSLGSLAFLFTMLNLSIFLNGKLNIKITFDLKIATARQAERNGLHCIYTCT